MRTVDFYRYRQFRKCLWYIFELAYDNDRRAAGRRQRTESRYPVRIVEVPLVLSNADEIANNGVADPGPAQCSARQFGRNAGLEERADIGIGNNLLKRRQACRVKRPILRALGLRRSRCCFDAA